MSEGDISRLRVDDIVIAVMGPTGSGKSSLIDMLVPRPTARRRASDGLHSFTHTIRASRILRHAEYGDRLVLVDTPGFDDSDKSDMEILKMISDWLRKTYEGSIKLAGILYLHRITDNRMSGSPLRNLRMFGELCGDRAMSKVVLVTTMWNKIDRALGERRQSELECKYFNPLIKRGAVAMQFDCTMQAAWEIIDAVIAESEKEAVLIQEEMVELKKRLNETSAGKALYTTIQSLLAEQKNVVKVLAKLAREQNNKRLSQEMDLEYKRIQSEFERSFGAIKSLKIPLTRRILLLFGRKSRAKSLTVIF